jgi:hypothetical protein
LPKQVREKLLSRMGDVSPFMQELKQRISRWYNKRHQRFGTLWAERFKSLVVEESMEALGMVGRYIDLNPIRAGLVEDPAEYRWSGYGEAMGGSALARAGIGKIMREEDWKKAGGAYRVGLYQKGSESRNAKKVAIDLERVREEVERGGKVEWNELIRLRVRYFSDGVALGSREYVNGIFEGFRDRFGVRRKDGARRMKGLKETLSGLAVLRDLRRRVFD